MTDAGAKLEVMDGHGQCAADLAHGPAEMACQGIIRAGIEAMALRAIEANLMSGNQKAPRI